MLRQSTGITPGFSLAGTISRGGYLLELVANSTQRRHASIWSRHYGVSMWDLSDMSDMQVRCSFLFHGLELQRAVFIWRVDQTSSASHRWVLGFTAVPLNYRLLRGDRSARVRTSHKVARDCYAAVSRLQGVESTTSWSRVQPTRLTAAQWQHDGLDKKPIGQWPTKPHRIVPMRGRVARWLSGRASDLRSSSRGFEARPRRCCVTTLGMLFTPYRLCHQAV